jgi:hypothetical protein
MANGEAVNFLGDIGGLINLGIFPFQDTKTLNYETASNIQINTMAFRTNDDTQPTFTQEFTVSGEYQIPT